MMSMLSGSFEDVPLIEYDEPPEKGCAFGLWQIISDWLFRTQ